MKVYVLGNRTNPTTKGVLKRIVDNFEKHGHKVDKSWVNRSADEDANEFEKTYERNMKSIKNTDILVAEVTDMSSGVGFLISTALSQKKPVLALFDSKSGVTPSTTLKGSKNKIFSYQEYGKDNLDEKIEGFLSKVKNILDTKFILIISPEIDRYLEWAADYRRMHKAQIVRNSVEDMMNKDKEWKKSQSF